jgi:mono/diheme cytochrome c family protein
MKATDRLIVSLLVVLAAGAALAMLFTRASAARPQQNPAAAPQGDIARGKYLVDNVGMCSECHTPRDAEGNLDNSRYLQGAQIWITPVHPVTNWANNAPALAGFLSFTKEQGERILEKGIGPNNLTIQPPMHIYHMTPADADAIIAYLRSLPSSYPQR